MRLILRCGTLHSTICVSFHLCWPKYTTALQQQNVSPLFRVHLVKGQEVLTRIYRCHGMG
jgi:hypothetical protein